MLVPYYNTERVYAMYLKKLTLHGFKTFADKTTLDFAPGITCIVGPNGGGKSNIFDSIRFCLGEQSIKLLRAPRLEDIIFAGSQTRKLVGMAEVEMLFDNSDKMLPMDFSEVSIQRRIFREGENEFTINKSQCRLKDIQELLMGTGIGTGGLAFLSQSEVDLVLSSSENRRMIIEEIAGTNKYKFRKKEAERKLVNTDLNLSRLHDILNEVDNQLKSLESQVRKFRRYNKYKEKLVTAERDFILAKLKKINREYEPIALRISEVKEKEEGLSSQIALFEEAKDSQNKILWDNEERSGKLEETIAEQRLNLQKKIDFKQLIEERKNNFIENQKQIAKEIEDIVFAEDGWKIKLGEFECQIAACQNEIKELETLLQNERAREEKNKSEKSAFDSPSSEKYYNVINETSIIKNKINAAVEKLKYINQEIERQKTRHKELSEKNKEYDKKAAKNSVSIAKLEEALEENKKILESLENLYLDEWEKICRLNEEETNVNKEIGALSGGSEFLKVIEDTAFKCVERLKDKIMNAEEELACPLVINLGKDAKDASSSLEDAKIKLQNITKEKSDREDKRLKTHSLIKAKEKICEAVSSKLNAIRANGQFLTSQIAVQAQEINQINDQLSDLETENCLLGEVLQRSQQELVVKEEEFVLVEGAFNEQKTASGRFSEEEEEIRGSIQNLLIKKAEFTQKEADLKERREIFNAQALSSKEKLVYLREETGLLEEKIRQCEETKSASDEETIYLENELKRLSEEKEILIKESKLQEEQYKNTLSQLNGLKELKDNLRDEFYKLEIKKAEYETKYSDYSGLLADYGVVFDEINWDEVLIPDLALAEKQISRLKNFINNFGGVNLAAENDYNQFKERREFLSLQITDMEKAKESLLTAIKEYDENCVLKFNDVFEEIAQRFQRIFTEVFNGGAASLFLSEPANILDSGVDIKAQPPGKRLQNISLLSGGEKALTAVSFLFALLEVKNTPFVVLDELDAPLDDSNIERVARLVKKYSAHSQFLIITHNRKTMEAAELLYGVTMQEQGVSKILAVKLEEAKENYAYDERGETVLN